jgi:hypothetical protein
LNNYSLHHIEKHDHRQGGRTGKYTLTLSEEMNRLGPYGEATGAVLLAELYHVISQNSLRLKVMSEDFIIEKGLLK